MENINPARDLSPDRTRPPSKGDATAPARRSFIKVCSDHQRSGMFSLIGGKVSSLSKKKYGGLGKLS